MNHSFRIEPLETRQLLNGGGLDQSFGDTGVLPISRGVTVDKVFELSDGRLIVAGGQNRTTDGPARPYLLRTSALGTADPTYTDNQLLPKLNALIDRAEAFAIDNQERVLVAGQLGDSRPMLTRVTTSGDIDSKFGNDGSIVVPLLSVTSMSVAPGGDIFLAGVYKTTIKDNGDVESFTGLVALKSDGSIDTSIGTRGIIPTGSTVDHSTTVSFQVARDQILFDSTGNIIYARDLEKFLSVQNGDSTATIETNTVQVFRFAPDGTADPNFSFDNTGFIDSRGAILAGATMNADDTLQIEFLDFATPKNHTIQRYNQWISTVRNDGMLAPDVLLDNTLTFAPSNPIAVKESDGQVLWENDGRTIVRYRYGVNDASGEVDPTFTQDPSTITSNDDLETLQITDDGQILASYRRAKLSGGLNSAFLVKYQQSDAPSGVFAGKPITADRNGGYYFNVTWQDDDNVDFNSLSNDDIIVLLPDGSKKSATFISADPSSDAKVITARYRFTSPNGGFGTAQNGQYSVRVRGRAVADTSGNHAAAREIGRFNVTIPFDAHIA